MSKQSVTMLVAFLLLSLSHLAQAKDQAQEMKPGAFLVFCYHAVPANPSLNDPYAVPQNLFVKQMEYLRAHGYHPVSLDDILKAGQGKQALPQKPVLLMFDDAYISYYDFVVPILEKFGYPSVLAVVGTWIDHPPKDITEPLMTWDQVREASNRRLVEVVSHTYDLHKAVQYNPPGNVGAAVSVRAFDPNSKSYETEEAYRARIEADFAAQKDLFARQLGMLPRAVVWPYGRVNAIGMEVARGAGICLGFTLKEGFAHLSRVHDINRNLVRNRPIRDFIRVVANPEDEKAGIRAMQADLDLVYDPSSYEQTDENLGRLIDRLVGMKVNTVFLQAFADPDGTGNVKSVYVYNRVLPVRADIFSHAVHQMIIRGMVVYAWMPALSIVFPDKELNESLRVRERDDNGTRPSTSWYKRLTPFSPKVRDLVRAVYEDLAAHSQIHGVLFQDDAYLTDKEDYHPLALATYQIGFARDIMSCDLDNDPELAMTWARYKTEVLIGFTEFLAEGVRKYRPGAKFARNLYARVLTDPESETWFAQDYELFLKAYDQTVIMAYPQMDKARRPLEWLQGLVNKVRGFPKGTEKTVFKVPAYDWSQEKWVEDTMVLREIREILARGGRHLAYYPDDFWTNKPSLKKMRLEMSTQTYPFMPGNEQ
jgi:biofilm PGA synthesis lipoprotein PgaB